MILAFYNLAAGVYSSQFIRSWDGGLVHHLNFFWSENWRPSAVSYLHVAEFNILNKQFFLTLTRCVCERPLSRVIRKSHVNKYCVHVLLTLASILTLIDGRIKQVLFYLIDELEFWNIHCCVSSFFWFKCTCNCAICSIMMYFVCLHQVFLLFVM